MLARAGYVGRMGPTRRFDPDAAAYIARMTTPPDGARQQLIDDLVTSLKAEGVWDKLSALWLMAAADSQAGTLNVISSSYTLSPVNSPVFTADRGFASNGTTSYLDSALNMVADPKCQLNDSHLGLWCNVTPGAITNNVDMGVSSNMPPSDITHLRLHDNGSSAVFRVNQNGLSATTDAATATALGHSIATRSSSTAVALYKTGALILNSSVASTALVNYSLYIGASNTGGAPASYINRRYAAAHVGSGLTGANCLALYNALNTYLTAIGGA